MSQNFLDHQFEIERAEYDKTVERKLTVARRRNSPDWRISFGRNGRSFDQKFSFLKRSLRKLGNDLGGFLRYWSMKLARVHRKFERHHLFVEISASAQARGQVDL
jgi:hypothetical protein